MVNIPYGDIGLASGALEDFNIVSLFSGEAPIVTTAERVGASKTYLANTVVGRDAGGLLVPAVLGTVAPIGILITNVTTGAGESAGVAVYRGGMFNPDALIWDASYDTDEKKRTAFEGFQSGIFIQKIGYQA